MQWDADQSSTNAFNIQPDANQSPPNEPSDRLVTVFEAAELLGISPEAVRARIKRGTLAKAKSPNGTVYVQLDSIERQSDGDRTHDKTTAQSRWDGDGTDDGTHAPPLMQAHLDSLKEQLAYLREQLNQEREANRENRRIIAALTSRIPEIEPPRSEQEATPSTEPPRQEARESPVVSAVTDEQAEEAVRGPTEPSERPWWRRMFGG